MRGWGVSMETNFLVYIISHITITGYKTKTTTALHAFKIRHKLSVVSGLNNACPYPEPALTHLSKAVSLDIDFRWHFLGWLYSWV